MTAANPVELTRNVNGHLVRCGNGVQLVDGDGNPVALGGAATDVSALLTEAEFEARIGEVQATPTTNTVLGRPGAARQRQAARSGV